MCRFGRGRRNSDTLDSSAAPGPYMRLWQRARRLEQRGETEAGRALRAQMKTMPSRDPDDPGYRRLRYCRYADDWLLGFTGPRREAEEIKAQVGDFLRDQLALDLSPAKTMITHGRTRAARFLGYEIVVMHADHKRDQRGRRSINAGVGLKGPADVIRAKCAPYLHHGKPIRRTERTVDTDFSVVAQFQAEFRGVAEYHRLTPTSLDSFWLPRRSRQPTPGRSRTTVFAQPHLEVTVSNTSPWERPVET